MVMAYDSGKGEIFVSSSSSNGANTVSVISDTTNAVVATMNVTGQPTAMAYDPAKGEIFLISLIVSSGSPTGMVTFISDSTNTVLATVAVSREPGGIAYDSGKDELVETTMAQNGSGTVSIYSISSNGTMGPFVANIPVGTAPEFVTYDSGKGEIFVANRNDGNISVISDSTNSIVGTVFVGGSPNGMAYDAAKGEVFVADAGDNAVLVISDSTNLEGASLPFSSNPSGVAYDSGAGEIFVTDWLLGTVGVFSDGTNVLAANLTVGSAPYWLAYDSGQHEVFVGNGGNNTVSVISDLATPQVSPSSGTIGQGQTLSLTSTMTTGISPYLYQWFSQTPGASSYILIVGATASSYSFATSTSTTIGNWNFILQVTDHTGAAFNSTAAPVTVTTPAPTPSPTAAPTPTAAATASTKPTALPTPTPTPSTIQGSSAASTATVTDNTAIVNQTARTGVYATISGSSLQDNTQLNVTSAYFGSSQPQGTGAISVGKATFYDVQVTAGSGSLNADVQATITITNPSFTSASVIEYWNANTWVSAATKFAAPDTVTCTIPASALTGTPIAVGTPKTGATANSDTQEIIVGVAAGLAIAAGTIAAIRFTTRAKKNKN